MERVDHLAFAIGLNTQQKVTRKINPGYGNATTPCRMDIQHAKRNRQAALALNHLHQVGIGQVVVVFRIPLKTIAFGNHGLQAANNLINGRFGFLVIDRKRLIAAINCQIGLQGKPRQLGPDLIGQIVKDGKKRHDIALVGSIRLIEAGKMQGCLGHAGIRLFALAIIDKPLAIRIGRCCYVADAADGSGSLSDGVVFQTDVTDNPFDVTCVPGM